MKVQGKLTFMWILQSHNFQKILLCFAPGVSISPFLETHGLNYTENLTSTKWGFLLVNRSLPPSISPAPIFARSFSRSWSMSKIFCFFCCSPILSSAAECKLQQSASAIALGSVHPNGKFVFKRSRKTSQKNYNTNLAALEFLFPCFIWWNLTTCLLKIGLGDPTPWKNLAI